MPIKKKKKQKQRTGVKERARKIFNENFQKTKPQLKLGNFKILILKKKIS